uniref:Uncharacterized protein n=2 Tax=Anguilla anguilla TaxID=7936 RepID=A0A0E9SI66_ANGAN
MVQMLGSLFDWFILGCVWQPL